MVNIDSDTVDSAIDTSPDAGKTCDVTDNAGTITLEGIATWRDDAIAAYSIIHDDICDVSTMGIQANGMPILDAYGIKVGVSPYVQACVDNNYWSVVTDIGDKGHSILNHSYTHAQITLANAPLEVVQAKAELEANIGHPIEMFIFPFDAFNADTIMAVEAAGHLGARAGNRDDNDGFDNPPVNGIAPINDMELEFDAWPRAYSKYTRYHPEDVLEVHVWNAIERGGWAIREFHNVDDDSVSERDLGYGIWASDYNDHINWLAEAYSKNVLWPGAPVEVLKYRHARTDCTASVVGNSIDFGTPNANCLKWATPISVIVTTRNDVNAIEGMQNGLPVYTRKLATRRFAVTADPTQGNVTLSGCADTDFATVESGSMPPKPQPANSVCDIDTVIGPGIGPSDSGVMDDLTREPGVSLQFLPNPSQDDGRTGSWSWYPFDLISADIEDEDGNSVLHLQGGAATEADWAPMGITIAFLGQNGAGTCYDVETNRYTGIQFDIKGYIEAVDNPATNWVGPDADETFYNDKLIVCLVTAETQTNEFGGDLAGVGGHFCMSAGVSFTSNWQTIQLPFTGFNSPTWGDTISLSSLATTKMQAIDFGIVNTAEMVDIYLDNIRVY
jgi:hypothetical protein